MLKSKFIKALSLTGAILFAQTAWATPPSDELLAKYNQVYKISEQTRQNIIAELMLYVKTGILPPEIANRSHLNAKQQAQLDAVIDEYAQNMVDLFFPDNTLQKKIEYLLNDTLKKHYTAEEVQAMIDFGMTPIGQRIVEKQSAYMIDMSKVSSHMLNGLMTETYPKVALEVEKQSKTSLEKIRHILQETENQQNNIEKSKPSKN